MQSENRPRSADSNWRIYLDQNGESELWLTPQLAALLIQLVLDLTEIPADGEE